MRRQLREDHAAQDPHECDHVIDHLANIVGHECPRFAQIQKNTAVAMYTDTSVHPIVTPLLRHQTHDLLTPQLLEPDIQFPNLVFPDRSLCHLDGRWLHPLTLSPVA